MQRMKMLLVCMIFSAGGIKQRAYFLCHRFLLFNHQWQFLYLCDIINVLLQSLINSCVRLEFSTSTLTVVLQLSTSKGFFPCLYFHVIRETERNEPGVL
jgi:hypothetical protein